MDDMVGNRIVNTLEQLVEEVKLLRLTINENAEKTSVLDKQLIDSINNLEDTIRRR